MSDTHMLWAARGAGAVIGSAISLAYILPRGRREAGLRFATGLVSGLVFGGVAGAKMVRELGLEDMLGAHETLLAGAALASFSAWWALGALLRLMRRASDTQAN